MLALSELTQDLFLHQPFPRSYKLENGKTKPTRRYHEFRMRILYRDRWRCTNCGSRKRLTIHHILPCKTHRFLCFVPGNVVTLCVECHRKRHEKEGY
jgi:5-methylcytosine-specific restriction endonuclease McrA